MSLPGARDVARGDGTAADAKDGSAAKCQGWIYVDPGNRGRRFRCDKMPAKHCGGKAFCVWHFPAVAS